MDIYSYLRQGSFYFLAINLFYQIYMKGYYHFEFYKLMGTVDERDESFDKIFLTSTFYKYPLLILPYIPKYKSLTQEQELAYFKVKRKIFSEVLALVMLVVYFFVVITYSKIKHG